MAASAESPTTQAASTMRKYASTTTLSQASDSGWQFALTSSTYVTGYISGQRWLSRPRPPPPPPPPLLPRHPALPVNSRPRLVSAFHANSHYISPKKQTRTRQCHCKSQIQKTKPRQIAFPPSRHLKHSAIFRTTTIHQAMRTQTSPSWTMPSEAGLRAAK